MSPETIELAHFRYPSHYAYVYQHCDSGRIHCLKYSRRGLLWETFDYNEWELCKEYMITELPEYTWLFSPDNP